MKATACTVCEKMKRKTLRGGICRFCYELERNEKSFSGLRLSFSGSGVFNGLIFKMCLSDLGQLKLKRRDVRMMERVASILNQEPITQPQTWQEARALSKRFGIEYSASPPIKCPILRLAQDLKKEAKNQALAIRFENALRDFNSQTRPLIRAYLDEVAANQKSKITTLRLTYCIRSFQRYLNGADLFSPDSNVARDYFKSLKSESIAYTQGILSQLRRFYRWSLKRGLSRVNPFEGWHPESMNRVCEKCQKTRYFTEHNQLCDVCLSNSIHLARLDRLIHRYRAASQYNQHLFDLYIKYVKRSGIQDTHVIATRALIHFLKNRPLPAIRSWSAVLVLSKELARKQKHPLHMVCPLVKIGRMLQELGVLPIRQTDKELRLEAYLAKCPDDVSRVFRRYSDQLLKKGCSMGGASKNIFTLTEFQCWLTKNEPALSLFTLSEKTAIRYLHGLGDNDRSGIRRQALNRFYRWAKLERLALMNPIEGIPVPKVARQLLVCNDHQIRQIELYIKNPKSNPEYALILALALYWGITSLELALSSIDIHDAQIWINVYRKKLSRGRKAHNREQVLKLPLKPVWLAALQKRFLRLWRDRFDQAKKNFPNQPLLLSRASVGLSLRPLAHGTVINLFCDASIAATGQRIPPNVVRRTSGHIHVDYGDASRLSKLGWSKTYCHDFSHLPRTYFSPSTKP